MLSLAEDTTRTTSLWGTVPGIGLVPNSIFFSGLDVNRAEGITVGDFVSLDGVFTDRIVEQIITIDSDSYIIVSGADIGQGSMQKTVTFKSRFNTLPIGCGIRPKFVDVSEYLAILERYSADISQYRFYVEDSLDFKEFLESELLFPTSLYLIPRKGRISLAITRPSTGDGNLFYLDSEIVSEPGSVEITRSLNKYFYNSIKWYFNPDSLDESNYLDKNITVNTDSVGRFKRGVVPLTIESKGLRPDLGANNLIERNTRRLIDRFRNAPEFLTIKIPLGIGVVIEIGDSVVFGDSQTQITDSTQGNRNFQPRVFQVINKNQNLTDVRLTILETNYGINARYGIFAPASILAGGSSANLLRLTRSYGTIETDLETEKWVNYIGQKVKVRDEAFTFEEETVITGISDDGTGLVISPSVTNFGAGLIVEPANYAGSANNSNYNKWKSIHCFFNPQVEVLSGIDESNFTVNVLDQDKFLVGQPIRIHNNDFTIDSGDTEFIISEVTGNQITVNKPLPFTPASGQFIELIGFQDGGRPYAWV